MRLRKADWPTVIDRLVDACVAAAKTLGVHGRASVRLERVGDESFYVVSLRVPAGETVAARATKR